MTARLEIYNINNIKDIEDSVFSELERISNRIRAQEQPPLMECISLAFNAGTQTIIIQRSIQDPDFMAEYSAYYSKQFTNVDRLCSRVHFFKSQAESDDPLAFIDKSTPDQYLGFITLRPIMSAPVGASILQQAIIPSFIRCSDNFPVHIAGKRFEVKGTPFLQQDNAVGACAQASIWMSLRTESPLIY